jgi:hypothetical protein
MLSVEGIIDPWSHFSEIPQKINEIISQYIHENADSFCPEIFEEHRQREIELLFHLIELNGGSY